MKGKEKLMNPFNDLFNIVAPVTAMIAACVALDFFMSRAGERKSRRALHPEVRSYMEPTKRL